MSDKRTYLQVRMTENEKERVIALAADYGMDMSTFVRAMLIYFEQQRPNLVIMPQGKEAAPALM